MVARQNQSTFPSPDPVSSVKAVLVSFPALARPAAWVRWIERLIRWVVTVVRVGVLVGDMRARRKEQGRRRRDGLLRRRVGERGA